MPRETWISRIDGAGNHVIVLKGSEEDPGRPRGPRSELACPHFITDHLPELVGQHDGKVYTSKSALRASYHSHGIQEVGNDAPTQTIDNRVRITKDEIGEAYRKVKEGYKPELAPKLAEEGID
jgi:hypothetical protein